MRSSSEFAKVLRNRDVRHNLAMEEEEIEDEEAMVPDVQQLEHVTHPTTPASSAASMDSGEDRKAEEFWQNLCLDGDDGDDDDEGPAKRARLSRVEASVTKLRNGIYSLAKKLGVKDIEEKCSTEMAKQMLECLDQSYARKLERRAKHRIEKTGRRSVSRNKVKPSLGEMYSPPRLTRVAGDCGLTPEFAMDLTTYDEQDGEPWDLNQEWIQRKALDRLEAVKPGLVMLCPTCAPFSRLQAWNFPRMDNQSVEQLLEDGMRHLCFAAFGCILQHTAGRDFIFEHPDCADSWRTRALNMVASIPGVVRTKFNFCMLGMTGEDDQGTAPVRKTREIMTNGKVIAEVIGRFRCDRTHRHVQLVHGKAKACEVYPEEFCRKICEAYVLQVEEDQRAQRGVNGVDRAADVSELLEPLVAAELAPNGIDNSTPSSWTRSAEGCWKKCSDCRWMRWIGEADGDVCRDCLSSRCVDGSHNTHNHVDTYTYCVDELMPDCNVGNVASPPEKGAEKVEGKGERPQDRTACEKHPREAEVNFGELYRKYEFGDDVKGGSLDKEKVMTARRLEMGYFKERGVYTKVPRAEARQMGAKVITTKWVDTNKGSEEEPNHRSRLVGRELNLSDRPDLFAATPPLESFRYMISRCASTQYRQRPHRIMAIDASRAYFYGEAIRPVYIELPLEDKQPGDDGMVGRLNLSLYGIRDAAQNWAVEHTRTLQAAGFTVGKASPCNFTHKTRDISVTVHGDDFTSSGPEEEQVWLKGLISKKYDIKCTVQGPEAHHTQEVKILGRTLRWTDAGIEYEADPRHRAVVMSELGLESCRPVTTPHGPEEQGCLPGQDEPLNAEEATRYRALVARLNYLALDRPDIQFAVKEAAKQMSALHAPDMLLLKRLGRYLKGAPRAIRRFVWQEQPTELAAYVDSDWAGDRVSRKSTSGGMLFRGRHLIKSWSSNQQIIAFSSGEAELYAMTKGAAQILGLVSVGEDFGETLGARVHTDSSAALAIYQRVGLGKVRHLQVQYLWIQERHTDGSLGLHKVKGELNPADMLTKGGSPGDSESSPQNSRF